jgi:hypothetical protein
VFAAVRAHRNYLPAIEMFMDDYQKTTLFLISTYDRTDKALAKISSKDYAALRERTKKNLEMIMSYFQNNLHKLLTLDIECCTNFINILSEIYMEEGGH